MTRRDIPHGAILDWSVPVIADWLFGRVTIAGERVPMHLRWRLFGRVLRFRWRHATRLPGDVFLELASDTFCVCVGAGLCIRVTGRLVRRFGFADALNAARITGEPEPMPPWWRCSYSGHLHLS